MNDFVQKYYSKFSNEKNASTFIETARQVFVKMGVAHATMNDIAEASNKGRRTLYTYFKIKKMSIML